MAAWNYIAGHWQAWLSGATGYGIVSYAARTVPVPDNKWLKWLVGIFQFAAANPDKARAHFNGDVQ